MKLILGVSGSIGAYKAVDIMRLFQKNDHPVTVVMTRAATQDHRAAHFCNLCSRQGFP